MAKLSDKYLACHSASYCPTSLSFSRYPSFSLSNLTIVSLAKVTAFSNVDVLIKYVLPISDLVNKDSLSNLLTRIASYF